MIAAPAGCTPRHPPLPSRAGDDKARILKDETDRPCEYQRTCESLMSDGGLRKYMVVAETEEPPQAKNLIPDTLCNRGTASAGPSEERE